MRPRITLVTHAVKDDGGMERVCAELLRHAHNDYDFTVVSAELAPALRPLVDRWIQIGVPPRPIPLKFVVFWWRAGRAVRRVKGDLIHTTGAIVPNHVDVVAVHFCHSGVIKDKHSAAGSGAPWIRRANRSLARLLALAAEGWCYRPGRVRALAAVSSGVRDELLRSYPGVDVRVTPNGVDLDRFRPDVSARADVRAKLGLTDRPVAVFVGGDWDRKGLAVAIGALAQVRARGVDLQLWVVGAGDRARFSGLATELGLGSDVSFFGARNDIERFLAAADVFILPSLYEAFSLVTLEAAASELPVIMPRINGAAELVGDNEAGLLVERTVDSVATALGTLVGDADLRTRLGRQARCRATEYAWDRSVAAMTDVYASLLAR